MFGKGASRGDEKTYITVKNVEASSMTLGLGVAIKIATGASFDGSQAVLTRSGTAGDLPAFMGVAAEDIAPNAFGWIQTGGFAASIYLSNVVTSVTINAGDPLVPGASAGGFYSGAPTYANGGFKYILASNVPAVLSLAGATANASGWIRMYQ